MRPKRALVSSGARGATVGCEGRGARLRGGFFTLKQASEKTREIREEEKGFEPLDAFTSAVFKTAAFDHSATPPSVQNNCILLAIRETFLEASGDAVTPLLARRALVVQPPRSILEITLVFVEMGTVHAYESVARQRRPSLRPWTPSISASMPPSEVRTARRSRDFRSPRSIVTASAGKPSRSRWPGRAPSSTARSSANAGLPRSLRVSASALAP